jgi:hypothetical protein
MTNAYKPSANNTQSTIKRSKGTFLVARDVFWCFSRYVLPNFNHNMYHLCACICIVNYVSMHGTPSELPEVNNCTTVVPYTLPCMESLNPGNWIPNFLQPPLPPQPLCHRRLLMYIVPHLDTCKSKVTCPHMPHRLPPPSNPNCCLAQCVRTTMLMYPTLQLLLLLLLALPHLSYYCTLL